MRKIEGITRRDRNRNDEICRRVGMNQDIIKPDPAMSSSLLSILWSRIKEKMARHNQNDCQKMNINIQEALRQSSR